MYLISRVCLVCFFLLTGVGIYSTANAVKPWWEVPELVAEQEIDESMEEGRKTPHLPETMQLYLNPDSPEEKTKSIFLDVTEEERFVKIGYTAFAQDGKLIIASCSSDGQHAYKTKMGFFKGKRDPSIRLTQGRWEFWIERAGATQPIVVDIPKE